MADVLPFAGCLRADLAAEPAAGDLVLVGLPDATRSSFDDGPKAGPQAARFAYDGRCYNAVTELGVDLEGRVLDLGDWPSEATFAATAAGYEQRARELFRAGVVPFFLGGDHAVTAPIARALDACSRPVHVVQFDAHPDLYPELDGDADSHACVARHVLEAAHVASLTQIGIRTMNACQREVAASHADRLTIHAAREVERGIPAPAHIGPGDLVYVTVDLDGIDPAFAPGVSHAVPGGLTARQVLSYVQALPGRLVGMDVVELNPARDEGGRTAVLAGRLLHEGMGVAVRAR